MSSLPPVYATREDVMRALDIKLTARNAGQVDRALQSASRGVDGLCHRRFYPEQTTRSFDWPDSQYRPSWRLWLDDSELISLTSITSGGQTIDTDDVLLEPNRFGPPFDRVEINIGTSAAYGGGDTHQRDITLTGLFGYRNDETQVGALAAAVASTSATTITVNGAASASLGVGSVLRVGDERMIVTGRGMADTGQGFGDSMTAAANDVSIGAADGTAYAVDEIILRDSERMLIVDIAGNTLTVQRAWDGTVLAAHTDSAIYAPRSLTVQRGALGTTAATHDSAAAVVRWDPPGLVRDLTIAEAMNRVLQEQAGYSRTSKTSSGAKSTAVETLSLESLRTQVYNEHGRKARHRGV